MLSHHNDDHDPKELLLQLSRLQKEVDEEDSKIFSRKIADFDKLFRLLIFVLGGFVVALVWLLSLQADVKALQKEVDSRIQDLGHLREMWYMKEHGISNKEEFEKVNHYPAPNNK